MKINGVKWNPVILCPFCEWHIPYNSKQPIKQWKKHISEDKCYEAKEDE